MYTLPLFLPPPQPPLSWTGLSRKEMRSFIDGADVAPLGAGTSSPGDTEGKCVNILYKNRLIIDPKWKFTWFFCNSKSPSRQTCVFLLVSPHCVEWCMCTVLLSLLKVNIFSALIKNQILRGAPISMICGITNSLEANPGRIFSISKRDMETWILQCTYTLQWSRKYLDTSKYLHNHITGLFFFSWGGSVVINFKSWSLFYWF